MTQEFHILPIGKDKNITYSEIQKSLDTQYVEGLREITNLALDKLGTYSITEQRELEDSLNSFTAEWHTATSKNAEDQLNAIQNIESFKDKFHKIVVSIVCATLLIIWGHQLYRDHYFDTVLTIINNLLGG